MAPEDSSKSWQYRLETVKESSKNQNFPFDLQIPPTLLNGTYSSVPNRRAGPNKRAGGKIKEKE